MAIEERRLLDTREGCEALLARYGSVRKIADALGCCASTVQKRTRRHCLRSGPPGGRKAEAPTAIEHVERTPEEETREAIAEERRRQAVERDKRISKQLLRRAAIEDLLVDVVMLNGCDDEIYRDHRALLDSVASVAIGCAADVKRTAAGIDISFSFLVKDEEAGVAFDMHLERVYRESKRREAFENFGKAEPTSGA